MALVNMTLVDLINAIEDLKSKIDEPENTELASLPGHQIGIFRAGFTDISMVIPLATVNLKSGWLRMIENHGEIKEIGWGSMSLTIAEALGADVPATTGQGE